MQTQTEINATIDITLSILFLNYRGLKHFSASEKRKPCPVWRTPTDTFYDYPANLITQKFPEGIQY